MKSFMEITSLSDDISRQAKYVFTDGQCREWIKDTKKHKKRQMY